MQIEVGTGSLIDCALGKHGSANSGTKACWYNEANMNQSQTTKF